MQFLLFAAFIVGLYSWGFSTGKFDGDSKAFLGMAVVLISLICLFMAYSK